MSEKKESNLLEYKGKPLIRRGNILLYGNLAERVVAEMVILQTKEQGGQEYATNVLVQLRNNIGANQTVLKKAERDGLYRALDLACFWLMDELGEVE